MSRARDLGSSINSTAAGKNLVINGAFDFWQRAYTPSTSVHCGAGAYLADRWAPHQYQEARVSRTSITANSGPVSIYALRVGSSNTASVAYGTRMVIAQKIESNNTYHLRGKTVTLSFWIRFSNLNFTSVANSTDSTYANFAASLGWNTSTTDAAISSTGQDSQSDINISNSNSSGSLPTSWTKYTLTATVPTNANNILVRFGFGALGSSSTLDQYWYELADVQLEQGSSATAFTRAGGDIGEELVRCQRYFEKSYPWDTAIQTNTTKGLVQVTDSYYNSTSSQGVGVNFKTVKRTTPTIATYRRDGSATNPNYWLFYIGTSGTYYPISVDSGSLSSNGFIVYFWNVLSGLVSSYAYASVGHWTADAEL